MHGEAPPDVLGVAHEDAMALPETDAAVEAVAQPVAGAVCELACDGEAAAEGESVAEAQALSEAHREKGAVALPRAETLPQPEGDEEALVAEDARSVTEGLPPVTEGERLALGPPLQDALSDTLREMVAEREPLLLPL